MTFDYKAFLIAPKFPITTGGAISAAQFRQEFAARGLKNLTPYIYACFGDVVIVQGLLKYGYSPGGVGGAVAIVGKTIKTGCILPIDPASALEITGDALLVFFQH